MKYKLIFFFNKYSILSLNKNLNQIQFLQSQIRKYLASKKKDNKLFNRPQNKTKNNYLYLNPDDINEIENKNPNINNNSQNDREVETQGEIERIRLNNQEDDSFLNNEIKYVENLRIQNAVYTGELLNGKRHGKGTQVMEQNMKGIGRMINQMAMELFIILTEMYIKDIGKIIEQMVKVFI